MKLTIYFTGILILLSCGAKQSTNHNNSTKDSTTIGQSSQTITYELDYNNKDQFLSYGSVWNKPFDTISGADTVWFYADKQKIYTETEDSYFFYKHNKHWPKLVTTKQHQTVFLLERVLGEPEGSDIVAFLFENKKFAKKTPMSSYPWWKIDLSKDYSITELTNIIGDNKL